MSLPILFAGWFLLACAASWLIVYIAVVSPTRYVEGSPMRAMWFLVGALVWSFVVALGATMISTADLGWSP